MIDLKLIKIEGTQSRAALNNEVMNEYAEAMRCGAKFPPVKLFFDGSDYWLADGFHRYFASKAAEIDTINADIENGSKDDAILYSIGSNATHGLQRTIADKRNAVSMILNHPVWSEWSDRAIAKECSVTHPFVAKLRNELSVKSGNVTTTPTPVLEVATEKAEKQENSVPKEAEKIASISASSNDDLSEFELSVEELAEADAEIMARERFVNEMLNAENPNEELVKNSLKDKALIVVMESQIFGYQNKINSLIKIVKARDREIARLKKDMAKVA